MLSRLIWLIGLALLAGCAPVPHAEAPAGVAREHRPPVTILVSIDGFRADYLDRGLTPRMSALATAGVRAAMRPSFPSKTLPNHYTLVTGLRPDHHGVVDNNMEDPRRPGASFQPGNPQYFDRFWWDGAEPIWLTAERRGVRSATLFWPGSDVAIRGAHASDWLPYDDKAPNAGRVATVVAWLERPPATRPRFVALYFGSVDGAGHDFGPDGRETAAAISEVDARIGDLVDALARLDQPANLVVVADHGMAATSADRVIQVDGLLAPAAFHAISDGTFLAADARAGHEAEVAAALLRPHDHMRCGRKGALPARFEYGRNPRVPAFFCLAETGWSVMAGELHHIVKAGNHGYDNQDPAMAALFLASGPAFRRGVQLAPFDNVDVYPLVARLIGVAPLPSDAGTETARAALKR